MSGRRRRGDGAVAAVAAREWRRTRRSLLLLGVVAGLLGGALTGAATLARRTATAPERLAAATRPGDAHVRAFAPGVADAVVALPGVTDVWQGRFAVGRVAGDEVRYAGILAELDPGRTDLLRPVIVRGAPADPTDPGAVVVDERIAADLGLLPGDAVSVALLTAEEVGQFDTGFGEPDGPVVTLTVAGVTRSLPGTFDGAPIRATPAFAAAYGDVAVGADLYVDLAPGTSAAAFSAAVDAATADLPRPPGTEEFPLAQVDDPGAGARAADESARVLVGGLLAATGVGALAALVALAQSLARQHAAGAADQRVERALGMTARERVAARTLPAAPAAAVAGVVALAVAAVAGRFDPPGAVGALEPSPGWRLDVPTVAAGVALVAVSVLGAAAGAAWRAGRRRPDRLVAPDRTARRARPRWSVVAPRRRGWPLAGVAFALSQGARREVPVRTSIAGAVLGVTGVVAAGVFAASLGRLTTTPARYGWDADLAVVDVSDPVIDVLLGDERVAELSDVASGLVQLDGRLVDAYSYRPVRGDVGWQLREGRAPAAPDEVALGTVLAARLGVGVGDELALERPGGDSVEVRVVGIGLGPALSGEELGSTLLAAPGALPDLSSTGVFREAVIALADDVEPGPATAELAGRYEVVARELPAEVRDLDELGALPELLGAFLALVGLLAVAHAVTVTARRRRRDLAVLRALGASRRQAGAAVAAMAVATALVGVVVGAPLGWAIARLVWGELARSIGVAGDVALPVGLVALPLVAASIAAALAVPPARRVVRDRPATALRSE